MLVRAEERDRRATRGSRAAAIRKIIPNDSLGRRDAAQRSSLHSRRDVNLRATETTRRLDRDVTLVHRPGAECIDRAERVEEMPSQRDVVPSLGLRKRIDVSDGRAVGVKIKEIAVLEAPQPSLNALLRQTRLGTNFRAVRRPPEAGVKTKHASPNEVFFPAERLRPLLQQAWARGSAPAERRSGSRCRHG